MSPYDDGWLMPSEPRVLVPVIPCALFERLCDEAHARTVDYRGALERRSDPKAARA